MHKMTKKEKIRKGGKLASLFNLKLDPQTKLYRLAPGLRDRSAEEVFDLVHEVVLHVEYCEAVKKAVEALGEAEKAILNARLAAGKADDANGDRLVAKGRKLFPCNQAVVRATEPGLDAIRDALGGFKKEGK